MKSDSGWGAGDGAGDGWCADAKDQGCSAAAPTSRQSSAVAGLRHNLRHRGFPHQEPGERLLLAGEEEPRSPAKAWGATKPANKQHLASGLTEVFKCLSSRAEEGIAVSLPLTRGSPRARCPTWAFPTMVQVIGRDIFLSYLIPVQPG